LEVELNPLTSPSPSSSTSPIPYHTLQGHGLTRQTDRQTYQSMPYFNLTPSELVPDGATPTTASSPASTYSSSRLCRENLKLLSTRTINNVRCTLYSTQLLLLPPLPSFPLSKFSIYLPRYYPSVGYSATAICHMPSATRPSDSKKKPKKQRCT
jgi:hypothetical protein